MPLIIVENTSEITKLSSQKIFSSYNLLNLLLFNSPCVSNLLAISQKNIYNEMGTTNNFNENFDDEMFDSPLAFDNSINGLWNGYFVPPPPRPPFLEDIITDDVATCNLCSWALPTKKTFIFEGMTEKTSEIGWSLTLVIVSIISAILGAVLMVTIVNCRRRKSVNRND